MLGFIEVPLRCAEVPLAARIAHIRSLFKVGAENPLVVLALLTALLFALVACPFETFLADAGYGAVLGGMLAWGPPPERRTGIPLPVPLHLPGDRAPVFPY